MAKRRHGAKKLGFFFWLAVGLIKPFLLVFTKCQREGLENLSADYPPNDGVVVVSNHLCWFDPLNVCYVLWDGGRPPRFLAKDVLFTMPVIGRVMRNAGQIPVYRDSSDAAAAIRAAVGAVEAGECVVIYPEGTMSRDPEMWTMAGKTGAAQLALASGAPVIPMAQWGPQLVMRPYVKEFRLLPRKLLQAKVGPPVDLDDLRGKEVTSEVLREATTRIIDAITGLLEDLRGEKAPPVRMSSRDWKSKQAAAKAAKQRTEGRADSPAPERSTG